MLLDEFTRGLHPRLLTVSPLGRSELRMKAYTTLAIAAATIGSFVAVLRAENWSQFRGAELNGVAKDAKLPLEWGPENQILWKIEVPGIGWSQPIVWGDKV